MKVVVFAAGAQARIGLSDLTALGDRLAFTTDSYVVDPLFFPGGDIGTLAVNGTVNDLAVSGARPLYLSCGMILEEGLDVDVLRRVARSMARAAHEAGVTIVTGDTKVVHRGAADKLFINTAGVGVIATGMNIGAHRAQPGDVVLVNGALGDHGAAILAARQDPALDVETRSDCQSLYSLIQVMLNACPDVHCMRDATRGGVATVANEIAAASAVCVRLHEESVPVHDPVRGICELLGLDPLYMANEGKLVAVVPSASAARVLAAMRTHPPGRDGAIIGEVVAAPRGLATLATVLGGASLTCWWASSCLEYAEGRPHSSFERRDVSLAMHELSITQSIVEMCAERAQGARVQRVTVEVGCLSGIEPEALQFCYGLCAEGTTLEHSLLDIIAIPGEAACRDCGAISAQIDFRRACRCGSRNLEYRGGDALRVKNMEIC